MIRDRWIIGLRNQLVNLKMECDSCAAIESSRLTSPEREKIKRYLEEAVKYIDGKLPKPKK